VKAASNSSFFSPSVAARVQRGMSRHQYPDGVDVLTVGRKSIQTLEYADANFRWSFAARCLAIFWSPSRANRTVR
jgi:hypothetical protein